MRRDDDRVDQRVENLVTALASAKELLHGEIEALDRLYTSLRQQDQAAILTAALAVESRLDKMNEFRGALSDAQATMMPRAEAKLLIDALVNRVETMQGAVAALSTTLVGLRSALQGEDTGHVEEQRKADRNRTYFFAMLTAIVAVTSLYVGLRKPKVTVEPSVPVTTTTTTASRP